jgi:hypothetical protein
MNKYLLFILFTLIGTYSIAQSSCERNLNEARADYSNGNLYAIPGKLTDCLNEGFSKTEKIAALRLLTLTYININQQEKARNTFIKLLNIKTDYQAQENVDPAELYSLYRKIDTDIKYFIGVTFGFNLNRIRPTLIRSSNPYGNHQPKYSTKLSNPQVGIQFLYPLNKSWWVGGELQYQNHKYQYEEIRFEPSLEGNDPSEENIEPSTMTEYEGNNNGVNLNLQIRYIKDYYQWKPFIEVGTTGRFNFSYELLNYVNDFSETVNDENIDGANILEYRSKFNYAVNINLGTMIKVGENYSEIKFGVSNYFLNHLNDAGVDYAENNSALGGMIIKEDNHENLVFQISLTFNIPFFDFK